MRIFKDPQLIAEIHRFNLKFTCEKCVYFNDRKQTCANGWPTKDHLSLAFEDNGSTAELVFCKEFELV